jgi:gag-polypeptide of LTR copia-type
MAENSLIDNAKRTELLKLTDDGQNNNYGEWKSKAFHTMRGWDLWQYIEGPTSTPPEIPTLVHPRSLHGTTDDGGLETVHAHGNQDEYNAAVAAAKPWMDSNYLCLGKIVNATPQIHLHLVETQEYAKQAWENLRAYFQPRNSLRASTIQSDIQSYRCQSHMNISQWLHDLQRLYRDLCAVDPNAMSDRKFAIAILDNMVDDDSWRNTVSNLRKDVRDSDLKVPPTPIASVDFVTAIREEYWYRSRRDPLATAHVFTARADADKRGTKRSRAPSNTPTSNTKRARNDKTCTNSHCGAPRGHDASECIAFGGGSQGKYTEWWRGPWNIHLPVDQRNKTNNIPPESHPAFAKFKQPSAKVSAVTYSHNTSRSHTGCDMSSPDNDAIISLVVANETPVYSWASHLNDEVIVASLPILERDIPHSDHCHHDSAANRHVFHDRSAFESYTTITPLAVKGFGKNLSTAAIGLGTVRLRCKYGDRTSSILLTNVLHIPAARSNLVSGVRLDNAGVSTTLENGTVLLSARGSPIVDGAIHNDMYRLNLSIVRPSPQPSLFSVSTLHADTQNAGFYTA